MTLVDILIYILLAIAVLNLFRFGFVRGTGSFPQNFAKNVKQYGEDGIKKYLIRYTLLPLIGAVVLTVAAVFLNWPL